MLLCYWTDMLCVPTPYQNRRNSIKSVYETHSGLTVSAALE